MYIQTDVFGTYTLPYTYIQTGMFGTYTLPYTYIQTGVFFTYTLPYRYIQTDVFGTYIYTLRMYIPHSIHVYIPHSRRVWYIYIYLTYVYTSLYTWLHLISVSSITYFFLASYRKSFGVSWHSWWRAGTFRGEARPVWGHPITCMSCILSKNVILSDIRRFHVLGHNIWSRK